MFCSQTRGRLVMRLLVLPQAALASGYGVLWLRDYKGREMTALRQPNLRSALDARTPDCLNTERHWPGASESER